MHERQYVFEIYYESFHMHVCSMHIFFFYKTSVIFYTQKHFLSQLECMEAIVLVVLRKKKVSDSVHIVSDEEGIFPYGNDCVFCL